MLTFFSSSSSTSPSSRPPSHLSLSLLKKKTKKTGTSDDDKRRLLSQLAHLDANYSDGGLPGYLSNARRLLEAARSGANPFEGLVPEVPDGVSLDYCSPEFRRLESAGARAAASPRNGGGAGFVLVAGGLGERLGYSGIKLALPSDSSRGGCFLEEYIHSILALQRTGGGEKANSGSKEENLPLPLAIMTSPDTHARTLALLEENDYFGMEESQVTLMLQERVACLGDNDASLALDPVDSYQILTKPHGHGDVHALLHSTGTAKRWARELGTRWVCFFQDTNVQAFRALPAAVGVAEEKGYAMVSVAVPRRAGEAIGALARLVPKDAAKEGEKAKGLTINVEYNQLDPLLRATAEFADGDADDPETGFSPFPGNINQLVVGMEPYLAALEASAGVVGEFVNPKYKDPKARADFKSPARLECMMQDLPHALDPSKDPVGFLTINQVWAAYSPVKNSLAEAAAKGAKGEPTHSAAAAEADAYRANCFLLSSLGAKIEGGGGGGGGGGGESGAFTKREFKGVPVELWPAVSWSPLFALTMDDLERRLRDPTKITVSPGSALVVRLPVKKSSSSSSSPFEVGSVSIEGLDLDGALEVEVHPGASLRIGGSGGDAAPAVVRNGGWRFVELDDAKPAAEEARMRGFKVCKRDGEKVVFAEPGEFEFSGCGGKEEKEEEKEEKEEEKKEDALAAVA